MTNETVKVGKLDILSVIGKLELKLNSLKKSKKSLFNLFYKTPSISESRKDFIEINKIWNNCLEYELREEVYLHEFLIPKESYNSYLKKYLEN